jgi:mRNA-degrading endonuclease RelE of RelBE toxin-antitoxin system
VAYEVTVRRAAKEALDRMPERAFRMVSGVVRNLREDPRLLVHKLADSGLWRARVGRYRLICSLDNEARAVTILALTSRKEEPATPRQTRR